MQLGRWYLGVGQVDWDNNSISGTWKAYDGGQCSGCSYTAPTVNGEQSKGDFTITSQSYRTATMEWAGGTMPLERFIFVYPDKNEFLIGLWSMLSIFDGVAASEFVLATDRVETDNGEIIVGYSESGRLINAYYTGDDDIGNPVFYALYDASDTLYAWYQFNTGVGAMSGFVWVYPKGSDPVGEGSPFMGVKFLDIITIDSKSTSHEKKYNYDEIYKSIEIIGEFDHTKLPSVKFLEIELEKLKNLISPDL